MEYQIRNKRDSTKGSAGLATMETMKPAARLLPPPLELQLTETRGEDIPVLNDDLRGEFIATLATGCLRLNAA